VEQGTLWLARGGWIVIFPEGTRRAPGAPPQYKTGGARLAVRTATPVVPIALDSGELWPRKAFLKMPGTITVSIGPPIDPTGKSADQVSNLVQNWIESEMHRIAPHRYVGQLAQSSGGGAAK
jgi:1-acyl-sn-glycerol-3-phosphate acyltransferase